MSDQGWIDANVAELPPLTLKHIHQYFITGRLRKERVTATKAFKRGYRLFDSKKVQCLSVHDVTSTSVYCIIRATVLPSQKAGAYKTAFAVNKTNGQIIHGSCRRHQESTCYPWKQWWAKFDLAAQKEPIPVKMLAVTRPKYNHTGRGVKFFKLCWHMCIDNWAM